MGEKTYYFFSKTLNLKLYYVKFSYSFVCSTENNFFYSNKGKISDIISELL
jgi:hypothetical protein